MKQTLRSKPFFASTSLETNSTFEEPDNKVIKINVIHPQRKSLKPKNVPENHFSNSQDGVQVLSQSLKRAPQPAVIVHPPSKPSVDIKERASSNFERHHQTKMQNLNKNNRIIDNFPQNPTKMSESIYVSINDITDQKSKTHSSAFKEKQSNFAIQKDYIVEIAQQLVLKNQKIGDQLINISPDKSIQHIKQSQMIYIGQKRMIQNQTRQVATAANFVFPSISNQDIEKRSLRVKYIQSERPTSQNRSSNSKLKLRDYLYMVEATSKQSSLNKSKKVFQKTSESMRQTKIKYTEKVQQQKKEPTKSQTERSLLLNHKKEYGTLRYNISNGKMYEILKKQIHEDVKSLLSNLQKVDKEIVDLKLEGQTEPTNEDLLILYTIRRQVKDQMNKKIEQTLKIIKDHKKGIIIEKSDLMTKRRSVNYSDKNKF